MNEYFEAIKRGDLATVKRMTEQDNWIINSINQYFDSPLLLAAYKGKFEILKYLVENEANINYINGSDGNSAIHNAALGKNIKDALGIIVYLVDHGADINQMNQQNGKSALEYINEELFYNTPQMNSFNNIDELKRYYREIVLKPWKSGVWKVKRNNRKLKNNSVLVRNIQLPSNVSKSNLPPNVLKKISRLTVFGKNFNHEIKYLRSIKNYLK